jgi:hypothetical protein
MSAAEKFGRVEDLPAATLNQAREAGQVLKDAGVTHSGESAAQKYGAPATPRNQLGKSLSQQAPGRSL